jgi:hypothetical protein
MPSQLPRRNVPNSGRCYLEWDDPEPELVPGTQWLNGISGINIALCYSMWPNLGRCYLQHQVLCFPITANIIQMKY